MNDKAGSARVLRAIAILAVAWCGLASCGTPKTSAIEIEVVPELLTSKGVKEGTPVKLSVGWRHSCVLASGGRVWCWGQNNRGQLGGLPNRARAEPRRVMGIEGVTDVSAGGSHTCVVRRGEVWCWGDDSYGQLGRGSLRRGRGKPSRVVGLDEVAWVSAGGTHTCALKRDGEMWCWGDNASGQLGDGRVVSSASPRRVRTLGRAVRRVSAGGAHTCAVTINDRLWCWGEGDVGQLGKGGQLTRPWPVEVSDGVVDVKASARHTCGLGLNGSVRCWGDNDGGQLGVGVGAWRLAPDEAAVVGMRGVVVGGRHSCAWVPGEEARCWGDNAYGQLGTGRQEDTLEAASVEGLEGVAQMGAGSAHTCALTEDRGVWCWGDNAHGQLGVSGADAIETPTQVDSPGWERWNP